MPAKKAMKKKAGQKGKGAKKGSKVMTKQHPRWEEFLSRLEGPEGCNFREDFTWLCGSSKDRPFATSILMHMGDDRPDVPDGKATDGTIDVEASLAYFEERGGYCDCEVLFNVETSDDELIAAAAREHKKKKGAA